MSDTTEPGQGGPRPPDEPPSPGRPRRRLWRIVGIVVGVLALVLGALYATAVLVFPPERLASLLADEIKKTTGRDFRIDGGLSIHMLPTIAVKAGNVMLANSDWGSRPEMLRVRSATFEVSLRALLHRQIRILKIEIEGVDALLETDGAGRANWQFAPRRAPAQPEPAPQKAEAGSLALAVDRLELRNVRVTYRGGPKLAPHTLLVDALELQVQGDRDRLSATFALGLQRWKVEGSVGRAAVLFAGEQDWPFELRLASAGAALAAKGTLGTGPRAGALAVDVAADLTTRDALAPLGPGVSALPMPLKVAANLRRLGDEIQIDPLHLTAAGQAIDGRVTVRTAPPRPKINAELSAGVLDVAKLQAAAPAPKASPPAAPTRGPLFGDTPLPLAALPDIDLHMAVAVQELTAPKVPPVSALKGNVTLSPGRLRLDGVQFAVAGGEARGQVDLQLAAAAPPRIELALDAKSMSVEALSRAFNGTSQFKGGRANLLAKLALAGTTPRLLAASTTGDLTFTAAAVTLTGAAAASLDRNVLLTLLQAFIPTQSKQQALDIECALVRLPLRRGVAVVDRSIGLETREVAVVASGEVNLVDQTLRLEFRPEVKKGLGLNPTSLAQLLLLSGPLQDPHVGLDAKGAARSAATVGVAVATGGLSLLAPTVLNKVKGTEATACGHAVASGKASDKAPSDQTTKKRASEKKSPLRLFRR